MKPFSTKSDVYNWKVPKSQTRGVLRLRGGTGSPSPSPPPTRPTSPSPSPECPEAQDTKPSKSVLTVRPVRPPATVRSRSTLWRIQSPERRHTVPVPTDSPRSRRELWEGSKSQTASKQVAVSSPKSLYICSNNCGKELTSDRGRKAHENFYCPLRIQHQQVFNLHVFT